VGLVERTIEAEGISTICLSNIPDLTASVGVPRLVGIEHPFGQTVGRPGDAEGQLAVLRGTLRALNEMVAPGSVEHLPFKWPVSERTARAHPVQLPPIATHLKRHPWQLSRLLSRDIPR
jgi:D-proline reductase (dithiol) PrdB